eukprot:1480009-Rhodomonas_salina.1
MVDLEHLLRIGAPKEYVLDSTRKIHSDIKDLMAFLLNDSFSWWPLFNILQNIEKTEDRFFQKHYLETSANKLENFINTYGPEWNEASLHRNQTQLLVDYYLRGNTDLYCYFAKHLGKTTTPASLSTPSICWQCAHTLVGLGAEAPETPAFFGDILETHDNMSSADARRRSQAIKEYIQHATKWFIATTPEMRNHLLVMLATMVSISTRQDERDSLNNMKQNLLGLRKKYPTTQDPTAYCKANPELHCDPPARKRKPIRAVPLCKESCPSTPANRHMFSEAHGDEENEPSLSHRPCFNQTSLQRKHCQGLTYRV